MQNSLLSGYTLLRKLPFLSLIVLIVTMGLATFLEKEHGSDFSYNYIYGSWWFTSLWFFLVVLCLIGLVKGRIYKNPPLFLMHISFVVILAGALCTKLMAKQGYIVVKESVFSGSMQEDNGIIQLPFEIRLDTFYILYYPGTKTPADYVSEISIVHPESGEKTSGRVSMNNILNYQGYRFYQTSFEEGGKTSVLSVNQDVLGIPISYTGYALFILSMLWLLVALANVYRNLLNHPLLRKTIPAILLMFPVSLFAQTLTPDGLTVEKRQADEFGRLWMLYDGRISPVSTFAHDFTIKLVGKSSFGYLDSNQFLMSFLFFPEKWMEIPVLEVKDKYLQKALGARDGRISFSDLYDHNGNYKLESYRTDFEVKGSKSAKMKEIEKLDEKAQLIAMLHSGSLLQLYPQKINHTVQWYFPTQDLRTEDEQQNIHMIRSSLLNYYQSLKLGNENQADSILSEINNFQKHNAPDILPSERQKEFEILYVRFDTTSLLFKINLTFGILSLLTVFLFAGKKLMITSRVFFIILLLSFLIHTISIVIRTYIGGRLPFSNGFETMLLIAWCGMLMAILFYKKVNIILPFGFLLSGCTLLVAHLGMMNPKITPLVPVLSSPLLSIHVSVIMLSYTLFAFIALNGLLSIIQLFFSKQGKEKIILQQLEKNRIYSLLCLYPALLFLGAGIFIGAVWANVSWGRYWGWDPKEVWALITFLIYSLVVHKNSIKLFSDVFAFHVFGLFAFFSVLMTYFGVNYFLGGLHSYAGSIELGATTLIIVSIAILSVVFVAIGYFRYKTLRTEEYD